VIIESTADSMGIQGIMSAVADGADGKELGCGDVGWEGEEEEHLAVEVHRFADVDVCGA